MSTPAPHVAVIGAGIGGLSTALRLAHRGFAVTVLERHSAPGGKMRQRQTAAGPADAGPTVLTMKPVFDALFADVGERIEDHVTLVREKVLARHFWPDGTVLDLMQDPSASLSNVRSVFGDRGADEFAQFCQNSRRLFEAFDRPVMQAAAPSLTQVAKEVVRQPRVIRAMAPHQSLATHLRRHFSDPRLAQLFARYATYVGGLPAQSPALLGLIWQAESRGVWSVEGGMQALARGIADCARTHGARFRYDAHVERIETQDGRVVAVHTGGERLAVDAVVFNGDPRALAKGALGSPARTAVPEGAVAPRSLSASVMAFAAQPHGVRLSAHNVFFAQNPKTEYDPLHRGQPQSDPTLYVCAQDRFGGAVPDGLERFEIILNSPPVEDDTHGNGTPTEKERAQCQNLILDRLSHFGLTFSPQPDDGALTTPMEFAELFPKSNGSLYGRSPHGTMAAFKRPTARTRLSGLYLAGGGAHPGAGVPMATLSAHHAAEAITTDLRSTLMSRQADMPGGMSTGSATTEPAPFRSSVS